MKGMFKILNSKKGTERGFSLLEYCAGAAVLLVTVWAALNAMGTNVKSLLEAIGQWATDRTEEIRGVEGQDPGGQ